MGALKRQWERDLARFRGPQPGRPGPGRPGQQIGTLVGAVLILVAVVVTVWTMTAR